MADRRAQVVVSMGCLKVAHALPRASSLFNGSSRASSPVHSSNGVSATALRPFHGLVICVTGLSKDARKQVQEATLQLGGEYSPDLHPQCTHLVVQSLGGRKYEHALKHGLRRGLYVVALAWFVNCVKQNERLDESLYNVKSLANFGVPLEELSRIVGIPNREHSCLPALPTHEGVLSLEVHPQTKSLHADLRKQGRLFAGICFFVDLESSSELKSKVFEAVAKEGATFVDHWFIGSEATHVICEGGLMLKYLGFNVNLVTPYWVMKSIKERQVQRLVQLSADLARHVSVMLDATQRSCYLEDVRNHHERGLPALCGPVINWNLEMQVREREEKANAAKACVRRRRGPRMQPCRAMPRPITPTVLLDTICWTVTESPSSAQVYVDSSSGAFSGDDVKFEMMDDNSYFKGDRGIEDFQKLTGIPEDTIFTRSITESEKKEVLFKTSFLTVLFPIDRFAEIGPVSRTFFSEKGFSRQDILELIWTFYQEYMTPGEVEVALYLDSKHADRLRAMYADKETLNLGYVPVKRHEFLGSRRNFEGLKRLGRESTSNVYDLSLAA